MTDRKLDFLEKPSGVGKVYRGDANIATVHYLLTVVPSEISGVNETEGMLIVIDGDHDFVGERALTLRLEDGRNWEFISTAGNPITGVHEVSNPSRGSSPWSL